MCLEFTQNKNSCRHEKPQKKNDEEDLLPTIITGHLLVRHNSEKVVHLVAALLRLHDAV